MYTHVSKCKNDKIKGEKKKRKKRGRMEAVWLRIQAPFQVHYFLPVLLI
jgi:hypothetical protein